MPTYTVKNLKTKKVTVKPQMSFASLQAFLRENKDYEIVITAPAYVKVN
jgi:hypothetical protein